MQQPIGEYNTRVHVRRHDIHVIVNSYLKWDKDLQRKFLATTISQPNFSVPFLRTAFGIWNRIPVVMIATMIKFVLNYWFLLYLFMKNFYQIIIKFLFHLKPCGIDSCFSFRQIELQNDIENDRHQKWDDIR